jgi:hypothetical protein
MRGMIPLVAGTFVCIVTGMECYDLSNKADLCREEIAQEYKAVQEELERYEELGIDTETMRTNLKEIIREEELRGQYQKHAGLYGGLAVAGSLVALTGALELMRRKEDG